ncbi:MULTISPECIES: ABC transporter ATP-binding protein [unclassified Beijerinckia]|uniref:ABC transporter ATP-binding protein n=1 Tax=unclassified Beijerinckia TaxID=2638183 RepID=UPI00089636C7|nr:MULTISPECIES: ABC transporter ATP-binding protein [unclassified Beijerinckia]MDH7798905.1 branched-chain amino acid transport system ATP-binding protein [Beijerinckia sp. GAS462]SED87391.1 branched-chain amino acid transport system ATP-binding protein [Beijerinckia sp. 28-YEA-48]
MSDLTVVDLDVMLNGAHIVQGISFGVPQGRSIAILGPNGAGKTTLVRALMGLGASVSTGRIMIGAADLIDRPAWERVDNGIAYVPQSRRIFPSLTVDEHLTVAMRNGLEGHSWSREAIFQLFPNLEVRRAVRGGLSGGEQQMLAIARALVSNPRLIILDEPTEGLSPAMVRRVMDVLQELKRRGIGILLVEQDHRFAAEIADEIYVLQAGRIVFHGKAADEAEIKRAVEATFGFGDRIKTET